MSIGDSLSFSFSINITKRDENMMASSAMVQSLLASTKNKIVVQNNNLGLAFEKWMMFLSRNLEVGIIVTM